MSAPILLASSETCFPPQVFPRKSGLTRVVGASGEGPALPCLALGGSGKSRRCSRPLRRCHGLSRLACSQGEATQGLSRRRCGQEGKKYHGEAWQVFSGLLAGKVLSGLMLVLWASAGCVLCSPGLQASSWGLGWGGARPLGRLWGITTAIQLPSLERGRLSRGLPEPAFPKCIAGDCPDVLSFWSFLSWGVLVLSPAMTLSVC